MTVLSDGDLVPLAKQGDRPAQRELVNRWQDAVYRIAWRVLGSEIAAEDVRQLVFLRMVERPETLPEPDRFAGWIRRCTVHAAISHLRSAKVRRAADLPENTRADSISPIDKASKNEDIVRLQAAMDTLEPEERAILTLRFDEDLGFPQIAEILDRPATTIKSQYARLLKRLHFLLKESAGSREEIERHV